MENYRHGEEGERRILQCASCDATVVAETTGEQRRDADTVCALCGMTMTDATFEGADYFDVVMRAGRKARLEHFPAKWMPVRRQKMRSLKEK